MENQGRVGSPNGPKIQARSAAWREEGLSKGRRDAETGERMAETENQGRVGSPSGPKIQARSAAWREEGLSKGPANGRKGEGGNRRVAEF